MLEWSFQEAVSNLNPKSLVVLLEKIIRIVLIHCKQKKT